MWVTAIADRPSAVLPIARRMRDMDRQEIFACRQDDDPVRLAQAAIEAGPLGWVCGIDAPIAAFGCHPMWPGVWSAWLFATDDFGQIGFSMTKLVARTIVPMLFDAGAHRLEARSMEGHADAQRWLEVTGAQRECTLKGYGREGQDFHVYTWARS